MFGARPAITRPIEKSTPAAMSGGNGPERSAQLPDATMPTTPAANGTENASANRLSPWSSSATSGMIVVTAITSNAAMKMSANMPIDSQR